MGYLTFLLKQTRLNTVIIEDGKTQFSPPNRYMDELCKAIEDAL